jgi:hypothetical protein
MERFCFYHAGCPDGFGAVWSVWRAWGDTCTYVPRGHDDPLDAERCTGGEVVFVDIAPPRDEFRELAKLAGRVVVLDHHVSARDRFEADEKLADLLRVGDHHVDFDLTQSGAVLAWRYFHPGDDVPELLRYVQDQDLWTWKLPGSEEVNAAIGSYPHTFQDWEKLCVRPVEELRAEGEPILRTHRREVETALRMAHPVTLGELRLEAVNALQRRSFIGHELAKRAAFGHPVGLVYRVWADRVDASVYSIGDFDVARLAAGYGGGGHRNAAGFHVPLEEWLRRFIA